MIVKYFRTAISSLNLSKMRSILKPMYKNIFFFGFRYKCILCGHRLRTFLPFGLNFPVLDEKKVVGGGYRRNAKCPFCGSTDRERLVYLYLSHRPEIYDRPVRLLHIAPEFNLSKVLRNKKNIDYISADIAMKNVRVRMDILDIPFPENSFDVIICNHVLEHVPDDKKAISEIYRVLKPGGWAILQVPISLVLKKTYEDPAIKTEEDREKHFGQGDHVRIYARDYKDRLSGSGFELEVFKWTDHTQKFGGHRNIFGLNEQESLYLARKKF